MSICSKYNDEERKQLDKTQYMRMASYDDILQLTDIVFDVAALIRESTDSDEQKKAFAVQKDMVLELIDKKANFRLSSSNIFEELGRSGLRASDRPAFQLMCKRASQHAFDILVVDAVSRLARNVRELFDVIYDFQELGIGIIILKEKYWTYNMTHTDILRLSLMDDKNFNIVARMMIPIEECKRYCEKEANRKFRAKFWRPITIKIAIQ